MKERVEEMKNSSLFKTTIEGWASYVPTQIRANIKGSSRTSGGWILTSSITTKWPFDPRSALNNMDADICHRGEAQSENNRSRNKYGILDSAFLTWRWVDQNSATFRRGLNKTIHPSYRRANSVKIFTIE
jgi:hypothetical protein